MLPPRSTPLSTTGRLARTGTVIAALSLAAACAGETDADQGSTASDPGPVSTTQPDEPSGTGDASAPDTSAPQGSAPAAGSADGAPVVDLGAFTEGDQLADHGSAAFVLLDGVYHFISEPDAEDASLSHIDPVAQKAWGWSRDLSVNDPEATTWSWELDLATGKFSRIDLDDTNWTVLRGGTDAGTLVGKLSGDGGTPDDDTDDATFGFMLNADGGTERVDREGYGDIGFTDANADGIVTGFNDFGTLGFVYSDGGFEDLVHPDAFRLFPFSINDDGVVVGFWGQTEENWFNNWENPGFVATPIDGSYQIEQYSIPGFTGTGLTSINNSGQIAGMAWESAEDQPAIFIADTTTSLPTTFDAPSGVSPFVTGMTDTGAVFGQAFLFPHDDGGEAESNEPSNSSIERAVAGLSGVAHSGPFASALHGYIHQLEDAAAAADESLAAGIDAEAALGEVSGIVADARADVQSVPDATDDELADVLELLDAVDDAVAEAAGAAS